MSALYSLSLRVMLNTEILLSLLYNNYLMWQIARNVPVRPTPALQ